MSKKTNHAGLLIAGWVLIVICAYYIFHKPISSVQFENLFRVVMQTVTAGTILSIAGGVGNLIYKEKGLSNLELFSVQAALGFGVLSLLFLLEGVTIGFRSNLQWAIMILAAAALRNNIRSWWVQGEELFKIVKKGTCLDKFFWILILSIAGFAFFRSLAPPIKYDSLVYHLSLPKRYLLAERFAYIPGTMFWGMPQVVEMLFTGAMAMAGAEAAVLVSWSWGVMALILSFVLVERAFGQTAGLIGVLSLLSGFSTAQSLSWGYSGWMNILFGGAFLVAFRNWTTANPSSKNNSSSPGKGIRDSKLLILAGVFAGFALGTKYTSGVLVIAGIVFIALNHRFKSRVKNLSNLMVFLGAAVIAFSPWIIKNIVGTGNPFYPFLYPAGSMDSFRIDFYQNYPRDMDWLQVLVLPFTAGIMGREGALGFGASVGPLLTAFSFVTVVFYGKFTGREKQTVRLGWIISAVTYGLWITAGLLSGHLLQTRLYYSGFPALILLAGAGYKVLSGSRANGIRIRFLINSLVTTVLIFGSYQLISENAKSGVMDHFFSYQNDQKYLENNLGWYALAMDEVRNLPDGERALLLWEPRGYYCLPKCDSDEIIDRWAHDLNQYKQWKNVISEWQKQGYTHFLYYQSGANFVRASDTRYEEKTWLELEKLLGTLELEKNFGDVYQLYRLGNR